MSAPPLPRPSTAIGGGGGGGGEKQLSPIEKFRKTAKNVARLTASAKELDDATAAAAAAAAGGGGGVGKGASTRRRKSIAALAMLGFSPLGQAVPAPSADQLSLACLIESLEHFERFAARHAAAKPRQLLYSGWLLRVIGKVAEAEDLMESSLSAATQREMAYDAALARRELGRARDERPLLEASYRELHSLDAHHEKDIAKEELMRLGVDPHEIGQLDTAAAGASASHAAAKGGGDSRRTSLPLFARKATKGNVRTSDTSLREGSTKSLIGGNSGKRGKSPVNGQPADADDYKA